MKDPFVVCPLCEKNTSALEAIEGLDKICSDSSHTSEIIAKCIKMEARYGPEVPASVLSLVEKNFPMHEEVVYLVVKMNKYETLYVKSYLSRFANIKKKASFAEEFLTKTLTVRNMEYIELFETYIKSKLRPHRQKEYIELMRELKKSYVKVSSSPMVLWLLYALYLGGGAINVGMVAWFIIASLPLWAMALIATASIIGQVGLLYLHNRIFGNRYSMNTTEKLYMVIYLSTIVIATGGVFLGWLVRI
ncbi:MAG: hypothetical protein FWE01_03055 [Firmicutes bacterium]|nr:hypothetical protein [Bacillota bacterium]